MADSPFLRAVLLSAGLLGVSLVAVGAGLGGAMARPEDAALAGLPDAARKQANELYSSVRWKPWSSNEYMRLGEFFLANNRPAKAIEWLHRATVWSSGAYQPWYYIGLAQLASGRTSEAQAAFHKVLELNPDYIAARVQLANIMLDHGQADDAANAYTSLLRAGADQTRIQLNLGKALMRMGDNASAGLAFSQALARFSAFGEAHAGLAAALKAQGEESRAAREAQFSFNFRNVVPLHTDDPLRERMEREFPTALTLFQEAARTRDTHAAIEIMERALSLDPSMTFGWEYMIALYGRAHRPQDARRAWESLRKLEPNSVRGRYELAVALTQAEDRAPAAELLNQAITLDPAYAEAHRMLGVVNQLEGNLPDADRHFRAALEIDPALAEAHVDLGMLRLKEGRTSAAQAELLRALAPPCEQPDRILIRELAALQSSPIVPSFEQAVRTQAAEQNRLTLITLLNNRWTRAPTPYIGLPDIMEPAPVTK
jgi:tetratricopeptide (TPR) repeat protein